MKQTQLLLTTPLFLFMFNQNLCAQTIKCGSEKAQAELLANPGEKEAREQYENEIQQYVASHPVSKTNAVIYTIPVVFHVYGGPTHTFWGKTVTDTKVINALANVNKDFMALNSDYSTVNSAFASIKSPVTVQFCLATKDPNGNTTNGIDYKTTTGAGYGNGGGYDSQIAADAWDNKKYMNVYIVADLYNDGTTNNSGVAWYPSTSMSNSNTARVVYNGQYLGSNTSVEFASVLTHEFGHWLNLIHTFENGCSGGDNVADTPADNTNSNNCSAHTSCTSLENYENYMDYTDCYKNFTAGQAARVYAALASNVGYRSTLCSTANLQATGCYTVGIEKPNGNLEQDIAVYPNPSANGIFKIETEQAMSELTISVIDICGKTVKTEKIKGFSAYTLNLSDLANSLYFLQFSSENRSATKKIFINR